MSAYHQSARPAPASPDVSAYEAQLRRRASRLYLARELGGIVGRAVLVGAAVFTVLAAIAIATRACDVADRACSDRGGVYVRGKCAQVMP